MAEFLSKEQYAKHARGVLRELQLENTYIESAAVVSRDGLIIASLLGDKTDADRFAAMCASLIALAARATEEVDRGELRQIILDGTKGAVLLTYNSNDRVLAVAAQSKAFLGKLIMDTRKAATKLA